MRYIFYRMTFLHLVCAMMTLLIFMAASNNLQAASYNSKTGELFLPSLVNGSKTWTDVTLKLKSNGTYEMQSGTKSALPFVCPKVFTQATFDLIKSQTSISTPEEINALLGCRWLRKDKTVNAGNELMAETSSTSYAWLDENCSSLNAGFSDAIAGVFGASIRKMNTNCITGVRHIHTPYDLKSKLFLVGSVKVK